MQNRRRTIPSSPSARSFSLRAVAVSCALAGVSACSAEHYREEADREVYGILEKRREQLFGGHGIFTIDPPASPLRDRLLGEAAESRPAEVLSLKRALAVAAENSREYQSEKEAVYVTTLNLTFERYRLGYIPAVDANASLLGTGDEAGLATGVVSPSLSRVLGSGAQIVGSIGIGIFKNLLSSDGWRTLPSSISLAITQPILRGFGPSIVEEPLTQAERNVVYALRGYERFRQEFAVNVASQLYRILQQADVVRNEKTNYDNLQVVRARNEALAQAGRLSEIEVGQAQQNELSARNRWIVAQQVYESLLDNFKILLGLPTAAPIEIDPNELTHLIQPGSDEVPVDEAEAFRVAKEFRLDYRTSQDRLQDATRRVSVAADALRAGLDVNVSYAALSKENAPANFPNSQQLWSVGLAADLPVDRLQERNTYRASLIALDAEGRAASLATDNVRLEIRAALRELAQTRQTFEIQRTAVSLAQRRVESTMLYQQAGRSSTRDVLDAQESLVQAQNLLTAARIDSTLARLALYRDLGALQLDENGLVLDPEVVAAFSGGPP